jgi:hypothetical protein
VGVCQSLGRLVLHHVWGHDLAEIQKFPYFTANPKLIDGLRRAGMPEE